MFTHKNLSSHQQGFSLLEIILVLAIISLILIWSIRQYQQWQMDATVERVDYNVDALFQAMQFYYHAQCSGTYDPNKTGGPYPPMDPGTLNPAALPSDKTTQTLAIDIQQDLVNAGYLSVPYPFPANNFVTGYTAYYIVTLNPRTQAVAGNDTARDIASVAQIWMQVGVQLATTNAAVQMAYLRILNGTCLATTPDSTCDTIPGTGSYVIWLREPSFASAKSRSDYWVSNPNTAQFKQLYTTYPVNYLTGTAPLTGQGITKPFQTILCGS